MARAGVFSKKRKAAAKPESDSNPSEDEKQVKQDDDSLEDEVMNDEFAGSDDEDEQDADAGDGLANTMAQLLKQSTGSKLPILAGRKTKLMKEMEASKKESETVLRKRDERRKKIYDKMDTAATNDVLFERELRKLATKGVVALFNAVAKSKRDAHAEELLKKKKFSHENDAGSLVTQDTSVAPKTTTKGWKAVSDEQIPLDWDKDEFDDE